MEILNMYLVYPKGQEHKTSIVVETSGENARNIALQHPEIEESVSQGVELECVNVTYQMHKIGYNVDISKKGMLH